MISLNIQSSDRAFQWFKSPNLPNIDEEEAPKQEEVAISANS